ncbi:hypothetical protein [Bosea minatitlanensis]|uniref:C2H2-type domain-containing protein n=1 Tax=Bosea minatitlanensis TaxID=128782 RepID=A0ABW0EW19_9HYPH|nr:hypothetical protein [Bosea minatitlanensis]MCT4496041.1 hypothetical protein [Bosea minatitlanensis]
MQHARIEFPAEGAVAAFPAPATSRSLAARLAVASRPRRDFECLECGEPFQSVEAHAEFCCAAHRKAWNNRRMVRGAQLYDLWMMVRYERGLARLKGLRNLMSNLSRAYRDADRSLRNGRRSWRRCSDALGAIPMAYGSEGDGR